MRTRISCVEIDKRTRAEGVNDGDFVLTKYKINRLIRNEKSRMEALHLNIRRYQYKSKEKSEILRLYTFSV